MLTTLIHRLFRSFPPVVRETLKTALAATGHRKSVLDKLRASTHAAGKKRIDKVALRVLSELTQAGIPSLMKQRCMEFGAGYVPTELLVYLALGAADVVAVDYNRIAKLEYLAKALDSAPSGWERNLEELTGCSDFNILRITRRLTTIDDSPYDGLRYVAPFDMSKDYFSEEPFDFIHSVSVLEHLPFDCVQVIVYNLCRSLGPGGRMVHTIDLTDHWDADANPFGFLRSDTDYIPKRDSDTRGNRLRLSDWLAVFSRMPGYSTVCVASHSRPLGFPVDDLQEGFRSLSVEDLCMSEITLLTTQTE